MNRVSSLPTLAVSMGCPAGIGPEVVLGALAQYAAKEFRAVIFGDVFTMKSRAVVMGIEPSRIIALKTLQHLSDIGTEQIGVIQVGETLDEEWVRPGIATPQGGAAQLRFIDAACEAVALGEAHALVTAPVSKWAIAQSGLPTAQRFRGHTEYLGELLGATETIMSFVSNSLVVSLATTHVSIAQLPVMLTVEKVASAAYWTARFVAQLSANTSQPVAVLGLNPHAGEGGLFGSEEQQIIKPAIERARTRLAEDAILIELVGPLPAESAIRRAVHEHAYSACVAMYHDQATIPAKLISFGEAVNVTLGLPIVRTSVDHGTGYDIAGQGIADSRGMQAALTLAAQLAHSYNN